MPRRWPGLRGARPDDVLDDVARLLPRIEVEALFGDGSRLIVLEDPVRRSGRRHRPTGDAVAGAGADRSSTRGTCRLGSTSHFHVFEANRALRFDRALGVGHAARVPAGR